MYCTHREVKDVAPFIDDYDTKTSVYGWVVESGSQYKATNSGLVTQLFANGEDLGSAESAQVDPGLLGFRAAFFQEYGACTGAMLDDPDLPRWPSKLQKLRLDVLSWARGSKRNNNRTPRSTAYTLPNNAYSLNKFRKSP